MRRQCSKRTKEYARSDRKDTVVIVFAAASMTATMEEIGKAYMEKNPDIVITYNFDSSGTLKTQIEEGADCDIFISAASKQMDQLDITADEEIGDGSRFPRFPKTNHGSGSQGTCPRDS